MRVLLTGATGFVGRQLATRLIEDGHEVKALVRASSNIHGLHKNVLTVEADLLDSNSLESIIGDSEAIIHLAAYFDFYPADKDLMYRVNVDGTKNLMNNAVGTKVERFIYCSSTEAIGPTLDPPADEESVLQPAFDYGQSKVLAEESIREITRDTGLNHVILRPTGIMGEGDLYTAFELIKALNDGDVPVLPGDGEKHLMYTHISDVVEGFVKALTSEDAINQTIILCPDEPLSYNELVEFLCETLGVKPPRFRVPTGIAKVGIGLLSPIKNRKKTTFLWHMKTVQAMDENRWYSNNKAKRLLGWEPQFSMKEGISRAIEWYYQHGHLERRK